MKHSVIAALAIVIGFGSVNVSAEDTDSVKGFEFKDIITIPITSVKDQNKSGTCWCFATTSFFENEIIKAGGDSLDLSEMLSVRHCYADKADKYVRMYGKIAFTPGGSLLDVPYVWEKYGVVPEEVYPGLNYGEDKHVHGEVDAILSSYAKAVVSKPNKRISTAWREGYEGVLDAYFGQIPQTFEYKGKTYTPRSFADALPVKPADFVAVTSFTHHPFYQPFAVEVADNWLWGEYINVPMEEMRQIVDNALAKGHTVLWAADVSEGGFKWSEGVALMPKGKDEGDMTGTELSRWVKLSDKERAADKYNFKSPVPEETVTQESRQAMFDRQETTDDHAMEIVGLAEDREGNKYYKVKNSWDTNQIYDGFIYVSMPYFDAKTVDIYVNKSVVPSKIAKKMGL